MKNSHDFTKWEARSDSTVDKVNLIAKILLYVVSLLKLSPDLLNTIRKKGKFLLVQNTFLLSDLILTGFVRYEEDCEIAKIIR